MRCKIPPRPRHGRGGPVLNTWAATGNPTGYGWGVLPLFRFLGGPAVAQKSVPCALDDAAQLLNAHGRLMVTILAGLAEYWLCLPRRHGAT